MSGWGNGEPENYTHIIPMPNYYIFFLPILAFTTQILREKDISLGTFGMVSG